MHEDLIEIVLLLLREGSTGHAVELYCEVTGAARPEARRCVDELARRHGLRPARHRWLPFALLAGASLIAAFLWL
ncbi:MAG: hypothetical protein JJ992_05660 [Planctomycetes bacterium]|nr:hypothetical protein [Planctomycetota bacterium]